MAGWCGGYPMLIGDKVRGSSSSSSSRRRRRRKGQ